MQAAHDGLKNHIKSMKTPAGGDNIFCIIKRRSVKAFFLFVIILIISTNLRAQEQFVEPPARLLTTFSFKQLSGGVILLKGLFANFPDTLNFILDKIGRA